MAKFFAIDSNGLNMVFSESSISFVSPHCDKKSSDKESKETASFSAQDTVNIQIITLNGHCTSLFQFELFSWDMHYSNPIIIYDDHFPSRLSYRYLDSVSPPPRKT